MHLGFGTVRVYDNGAPLGPDRVENFGKARAALGQLLALDLVHEAQIGHVIVERDDPFVE